MKFQGITDFSFIAEGSLDGGSEGFMKMGLLKNSGEQC